MSIVQERCPACAAPLPIQPGDRRLKCGYCGAGLNVERHGSAISVELAQRVIGTIEHNGAQTQAEFRRLRLTQELTSAEMRLANLQSEIRSIERGPANAVSRSHLNELHAQIIELKQQIARIQAQLYPNSQPVPTLPKHPAQRLSPQRLAWLLFSIDGRANRAEFWAGAFIFFAVFVAIAIILAILDIISITVDNPLIVNAVTAMMNFALIVRFISLVWIGVVVGIKRFHDHDKAGWWVLVGIIPVVGAIWFFVELGLLPGTPGANRYG